jgi:peptide deformylase
MEIVLYPDPILLKGSQEILDPGPRWVEIGQEMLETMYRTKGVGLAGPQVGLSSRILVLNPTGDPQKTEEEKILLNPRIRTKKGKEWGQEGCLSFPGIYGDVLRSTSIQIESLSPEGDPQVFEAKDFLARVLQHELDHLEGIVFVQRMTPAEKIKIKAALNELEERYRASHADS